MALTLEDLNFAFDDSDIQSLKDEIKNGLLKPTTIITDTPVIINDFLKDFITDTEKLFETNITNLAADFGDWFSKQTDQLKTDIENDLKLKSDVLYDIYVKHAKKADDSDKFNGKSYTDMVNDLYTNTITPATVANALKFNDYTMADYNLYIKKDLKPLASDTEKAFGYNYNDLKSQILSDIQTSSGGVSLSEVETKVENEWTAFQANDATKFNGLTANDWKTTIIPKIKVDNATNSDKLNNYDYNTIMSTVDTKINDKLTSYILSTNTSFSDQVQKVKVDNATHADKADDSTKFDSHDSDYWKTTIIPGIKVDNAAYADNAGKFNGLTSTEWEAKISNCKSDVQSKVETAWTAYQANKVLYINGVETDKYDDHINSLIQDKLNNINDLSINATKFDGSTASDWKNTIIPAIKVTNATNADYATNTDYATKANYANFLSNEDNTEYYSFSDYIDYIKNNFYKILTGFDSDIPNQYGFIQSFNDDYFVKNRLDLLVDKQLFIKINKELVPGAYSPNVFNFESFFKNYSTKNYEYDDNGNLTKISFYIKYRKYDENDTTKDPTIESKLIKEKLFEYDDNNISKITDNYYYNMFTLDSFTEDDLKNDDNWINYIFIKEDTFTYDDKNNITNEDIKYYLKSKLGSASDYDEEELI